MQQVITLSYNDIITGKKCNEEIQNAFGQDGLGIIIIKDLPDFQKERINSLRAIRKFAFLPDKIKEKYSHPESSYSFGWSHGKEKMKNGVPDIAKGSYYANPIKDSVTDDEELKKKYPETYSDNIWPKDDLPELEHGFKDMSKIQLKLGFMMCKLFDEYLYELTDGIHVKDTFYNMISKSNTYKGRLLHYFPMEDKQATTDIDSFCGWHVDHGGVTVLMSPLYVDLDGNKIQKPADCGLYIKSRRGKIIKIDIPEDCLGVQLGEMLQYFSGGHLRATPHCVKACPNVNMTREQFAMFMDCPPKENLKLPKYSLKYDDVVHTPFLPEGVPKLKSRLTNANVYEEFVVNTINAYYNTPHKGGGS